MPPALPRLKRMAPDVVGALLAVAVILSARTSLADHYHVPTGSMEPTVGVGDRVVVNKLAYGLRLPILGELAAFEPPHGGDVVVLDSPEDRATLLKRVVATPGQEVEVRRGRLWIDGEVVPVHGARGALVEDLGGESHALKLEHGGGPDLGPLRLGDDEFLVVGDNRGNSRDGRSFGFVPRRAIKGEVLGVYWSGGGPTWRGL